MKKEKAFYRQLIFLLILSIFEPRGVDDMAMYLGGFWYWIDVLIKIIKCVAFFLLAAVYVFQIRKYSRLFVLLVLQQGIIVLSSLLNGNLSFSVILNTIEIIGVILLVDLSIRKDELIYFLRTLVSLLGVYIILNFASILLFPNGIYVNNRGWQSNYFLGYKNSHIYAYMVYLTALVILHYLQRGSFGIKVYGMFILAVISSFLCDSSTSLVAFFITTILVVFFHNLRLPKMISLSKIYLSSMFISILLIFFQAQNIFVNLIENILNRNIDFSGRTRIWSAVIPYVARKPILGNGSIVFDDIFKTWSVAQAHNYFLDLVLVGGLALLITNAAIFFTVSKKMMAIREKPLYTMLFFIWIAYGILFLMEASRSSSYMYVVLALCFNIQEILEKYKGREKNYEGLTLWRSFCRRKT